MTKQKREQPSMARMLVVLVAFLAFGGLMILAVQSGLLTSLFDGWLRTFFTTHPAR